MKLTVGNLMTKMMLCRTLSRVGAGGVLGPHNGCHVYCGGGDASGLLLGLLVRPGNWSCLGDGTRKQKRDLPMRNKRCCII